jgi:GTP-binding protein Era
LIGENLSIITSKAQTTRHRILGIISGEEFQLVFSDTPGMIKPEYELQRSMMKFVRSALEDADLLLFVTDLYDKYDDDEMFSQVNNSKIPTILLLNKIDQAKPNQAEDKLLYWKEKIGCDEAMMISALNGDGVPELFSKIIERIPEHPPYYPKDELTDKPERFIVSEIIREKIFKNYKKEVPYSTEVEVEEFHEDEKIIRIRAIIYVERTSQRPILLGHKGERIKKVGIQARKDLEAFFGKQVYLEQYIKVSPDWRKKPGMLKGFGY